MKKLVALLAVFFLAQHAAALEIELVDFNESMVLKRGQAVLLKAFVASNGLPEKNSIVKANAFGTQYLLFDDAAHNDANAGDALFAREIIVPRSAAEGEHLLSFSAESGSEKARLETTLIVKPVFFIEIFTDKKAYSKGGTIYVSGSIAGNVSKVKSVLVEILHAQEKIFSQEVFVDSNSVFSVPYLIVEFDPSGEWAVKASAIDNENNSGQASALAFVTGKESGALGISLIEPKENAFSRSSDVKFLVQVKDAEGNDVRGASVNLITMANRVIAFDEIGAGVYSANFSIPPDHETGIQEFTIAASKSINSIPISAVHVFSAAVGKAKIGVEVLSPKEKHFRSGDTISLLFTANYPNNFPLSSPLASAAVAGEKIDLLSRQSGEFEGHYKIPLGVSGIVPVVFSVSDSFGNSASREIQVNVEKENLLLYFFKSDPWMILVAFLFIAGLIASTAIWLGRKSSSARLEARRKTLIASIAETQRLFYKDARIDRQEYQKLLDGYSAEIERIDSLLEKNKKK